MEGFEYGNVNARIVLLQPVDEYELRGTESEIAAIRARTSADFRLIACKVENWNRDLSPWKAPAVFGTQAFGGGAAETLGEILRLCADETKRYYIGGYSLAGLFALWAAYQTDIFRGVGAASPSVWFPGFTAYMSEREIRCRHIYLSLGDKEEKTRNPVMSAVGENIRKANSLLAAQQADCVLEWNAGNHFKDAALRTAKAFAWVLNRECPEALN